MKRKTAKALEITGTTVLALALIAFIAWFLVPRLAGWTPVVVLSGSMEPALRVGAVAVVESKAPEDVKDGDIVTFRHPQPLTSPPPLVTHRVIAVERNDGGDVVFQTQGDANGEADPWTVPASNLMGTVKFSIPYVGSISSRLRGPLGFTVLVAIPALYLAWGEVAGVFREVRQRRVVRGTTTATPDGGATTQEAG